MPEYPVAPESLAIAWGNPQSYESNPVIQRINGGVEERGQRYQNNRFFHTQSVEKVVAIASEYEEIDEFLREIIGKPFFFNDILYKLVDFKWVYQAEDKAYQLSTELKQIFRPGSIPVPPPPPVPDAILDAPFGTDFTDLTSRHTLTSAGTGIFTAIVDSSSLLIRSLQGYVFSGVSSDFNLVNYQTINLSNINDTQYDFTIEFEASVPAIYNTNNTYAILLSIGGNTTNYAGDYLEIAKMRSGISNVWYLGTRGLFLPTLANVSANVFHHVALSRSAFSTRFYLDGILQAELLSNSAFYRTVTSTNFKLWLGGTTQAFPSTGAAQGARIRNVKITPAALYTGSSFTPPNA